MSRTTAIAAAFALLLATSAYVNVFLPAPSPAAPVAPLEGFPQAIDGWEGTDHPLESAVLLKLGLDGWINRKYSRGDDSLWLYIGYYRSQRDGAVPHSPRHCYPGSGWSVLREDVVPVAVEGASTPSIRVNRYVFSRGDRREYVFYWYQSRGRVVASEYADKAWLVLDSLVRHRSEGALVRFSANGPFRDDEEAFSVLEGAIRRFYPEIARRFPT